MLRNIKLVHFKCFEQLDLDCTALNLLCGLNGMGKSSVIQALLVLRQSFETGELLNGRLVLGGERIDLGTGSDILFEDAERDIVGFALQDDETLDVWDLSFDYSQTADQLHVRPVIDKEPIDYVPAGLEGCGAVCARRVAEGATVRRGSHLRKCGTDWTPEVIPTFRYASQAWGLWCEQRVRMELPETLSGPSSG